VTQSSEGGRTSLVRQMALTDADIDRRLTFVGFTREVAARITRLRPELRVLLMSGYADWDGKQPNVLPPNVSLLERPFTGPALLARVRQVLDAEVA